MTTGRAQRPAPRQPLPPQWMPAAARPSGAVRAGQVVAAQVALALPATALGRGAGPMLLALLGSALLLVTAGCRWRGRWLFEWLATAAGYTTRRHGLDAGAGPAELLALVLPGAAIRPVELAGGPAGVIDDAHGLTALLELGDPGDLLGDGPRPLPTPAALLPAGAPEHPPVRLQLLLHSAPAPAPDTAGGTAGTSYRQLTEGRLPGQERALLAVRVLRVDGWSDEELRRALSGTVRRIVRRLGPVTARPLGEHAALRVLGELAHHDGGRPTRETWQSVSSGDLRQVGFRLRRWPDPRTDLGRRLVPRLLALPATATSVALGAGPRAGADSAPVPVELTVRLTARTPAELDTATQALYRLVADAGAELRRLDGEQLDALAETLPLAVAGVPPAAGDAEPLELSLGDAGLMVGANRHGGAVTVRLFRAEGTRLVLVGGVRAAQLLVLRAMALGARVVVRTGRPRGWEPFVRGIGGVGGGIAVIPPGRPVGGAPASPLCPLLLVVDAGAGDAEPTAGPAWQATLVVRDELTPADADTLGRADLAVLQPLDPREAALAGATLGLGGSAEWLTRIRDDMVAVVNRRALRWALLSPTPIESQLIGRPARR
ncbi:type VII secretion protein EccE [Micromonospora sp. CPCC 205556]|uniref:type VII secretion protein EccE n=1 Tax=Micromonospora sp. CPCC 205556 TaxID=3122398 RepID=UPI003FA553B7